MFFDDDDIEVPAATGGALIAFALIGLALVGVCIWQHFSG